MNYTFDFYKKSADFIKERLNGFEPEIGIILGSGLNFFYKRIENPLEIEYKDIPGFLVSTAPYQESKLIFGTVEGKKLVCMAGRFHFYEGYDIESLATAVRVLKLLGIRYLINTGAVGAINSEYNIGDVCVISDQIKFGMSSPLCGPNIDEFGPRFPDMSNAYDKDLRKLAFECKDACSLAMHEGVYVYFPGPQYETPAEIRAARILGADVVGMSTVYECITAAHCGLPFLGLSLVTNMASGVSKVKLGQTELEEVGKKSAPQFEKLVCEIIRRMA